ncbi:subtilisin [Croceifilum oryzae]|uniref:Subtilisin n=1 Tax=Croceifilum oryzae TaxID=1553429 RepID=A0AAJ1WSI4_9BACL|nr:S8 family peptidase [Croceifilum oryzae]MDQ0417745.1 subtilisin [Croceifilum oryzae]
MTQSWWTPSNSSRRVKRLRRIYNLKEGSQLDRYIREMRQLGVRPVRFLAEIGIVIGEYTPDHQSEIRLGKHPDVELVEPDLRITITEPYLNNSNSTSFASPYVTVPWGVQRVEAEKVWGRTKGKGIKIAVIDTGIDSEHPAIKPNFRGGVNILSPSSTPMDYNGHGTHVAGTISGRSSEMGIIGVAPKASIYAVKAFNRKGSANLSDLLTAINWCIENNMNVINMSFGMEKVSESLRHAIQVAHKKGIVMIAASGNQGLNGRIDYPARFPETIAVMSVSMDNGISSFSNRGKGVDVAAPGEKIPSAWLNQTKKEMSGTSMAVPHVSGIVALILGLDNTLNPEQIRYLLLRTSRRIEAEDIGLVNAVQACKSLQKVARRSL